ncbi:MAG: TetR/AcrR family transcriptional regulator [Segniliparus sp.]|uniref:TetR/AcrR family transcriptional regulator n=1 Tax=Segniliparus sp. TaxID=2804064 RepID=UPI003F364525
MSVKATELAAPSRPAARQRRLKGPQRRELVLEAARAAFVEQGYDSVSMNDIAQRAGVARPVLYDHFPSKRALMLFLLTEETELLLARIAEQARSGASSEERMRASLEVYFCFLVERPLAARIFQGASAADPDVAEAAQRMRELARRGTAALLGPVGGTGREVSAAVLVASVIAVADWWAQHPETPQGEVVDTTLRLLWPGVGQTLRSGGASSTDGGKA